MTSIKNIFGRLRARERRVIVSAGALLLSAWLVLRAVPWARHRASMLHARTELATGALSRARSTLGSAPAVRDSLAARSIRLVALAPRLLAAASTAEASAVLSALVGGAAALNRVRIIQQDARADSSASLFTRIAVRLDAEGDMAGVAGWLANLEEGEQLIRVRSLTISAPEPAAPPTQAERLRVVLVVEGWATERRRR